MTMVKDCVKDVSLEIWDKYVAKKIIKVSFSNDIKAWQIQKLVNDREWY